MHLRADFTTVPLFAVLLLLATKCIDGHDLRIGIVGEGGVKPLSIMALFISLAYITISLDAAGLFRFLAFWVASKGGSSGKRLHLYFWVFFLLLAVAVGNDPVVLSGTPFIAYFTRIAGISPPTAWIYMQFCAANMGSAVLVSSNLTNLVLAGAFSISFTTFTAFMVLPFLAAAVATYPVFLIMFRGRKHIPRSIEVQGEEATIEPSSVLVDKRGAIFGSVLLTVTLGVLVGTSILRVPVWEITVPPAVIMFIRDIVYDWHTSRPTPQTELIEMEQKTVTSQMGATDGIPPPQVTQDVQGFWKHLTPSYLTSRFPTATTVLKRLPIALVPFALMTFVLVQALTSKGWVELFANGWAWWARHTGVVGVTAGMGIIGCILCNICGTNIGATIFAAQVLKVWIARMGDSIDLKQRDAAIYSLAIASNYGAFTFAVCASLAGLLWRQILRQKGIQVSQWQFCKLNLPLVVVSMVASCAVIIGEMYVVHKN